MVNDLAFYFPAIFMVMELCNCGLMGFVLIQLLIK